MSITELGCDFSKYVEDLIEARDVYQLPYAKQKPIVDRYYKVLDEINSRGDARVQIFLELLQHENPHVKIHAAIQLVTSHREQARAVFTEIAELPGMAGFSAQNALLLY